MGSEGLNTADRTTIYDPNINPTHPTGMWRSCPLWEGVCDPGVARALIEDWNYYEAVSKPYLLTQATTGAAAIVATESGVLEVDSNSGAQGQGANLQHQTAAFLPAADKDLWFEALVKITDTFDDCELFVGLSELDTAIIDTQANASTNHIGWHCVTNDGVLLFSAEKATVGVTKAAATIAEATYIKLGFYVKGITSIQQYIDGVAVGTAHVTANVPIVALYPSFVCQSGGTADPIMSIAGYRVFQLR